MIGENEFLYVIYWLILLFFCSIYFYVSSIPNLTVEINTLSHFWVEWFIRRKGDGSEEWQIDNMFCSLLLYSRYAACISSCWAICVDREIERERKIEKEREIVLITGIGVRNSRAQIHDSCTTGARSVKTCCRAMEIYARAPSEGDKNLFLAGTFWKGPIRIANAPSPQFALSSENVISGAGNWNGEILVIVARHVAKAPRWFIRNIFDWKRGIKLDFVRITGRCRMIATLGL